MEFQFEINGILNDSLYENEYIEKSKDGISIGLFALEIRYY